MNMFDGFSNKLVLKWIRSGKSEEVLQKQTNLTKQEVDLLFGYINPIMSYDIIVNAKQIFEPQQNSFLLGNINPDKFWYILAHTRQSLTSDQIDTMLDYVKPFHVRHLRAWTIQSFTKKQKNRLDLLELQNKNLIN